VVVRHLQPQCSVIMLYADATNPTSNGVYDRLGFKAAAEIIEIELASAPDDFDNHFH
jgi:RimJ/RimL family protein N-acetyltransferase